MKVLVIVLIIIIIILAMLLSKLLQDLRSINAQTKIKLDTNASFTVVNDLKIKELNNLIENLNQGYHKYTLELQTKKEREKEFKEMLSSIAHDVRTPLTSVQGYLQMLEETSKTEENVAYYEIIDRRIEDIRSLLEQFFLYAKVMNQEDIVPMESCNLYTMCCQTIADFYHTLYHNKWEPEISFEDTQFQIEANKDLMTRVFDNIMMNAMRHGDGEIKIIQKGQTLCFSNRVKEPDKIDSSQVFTRFYKGDTARQQISSGLGLTIVKEIMEAIGGIVEATLEENIFMISITFHN